MNRTTGCFAALLAITQSPYSCHKPTPQEDYADAKRCFAALDANLKVLDDDGWRRAGLDRGAVELAAQQNLDAAYDIGEQLGGSPAAVGADLRKARAAYVRDHSWRAAGGGGPKFAALGFAVKDCLADYYGRPND